ncbi:Decaprenyl diphosphate synthase-like protein [Xylariaceae sp. FL0016]|nr:Decaprenyl diphosphate synthase-like protein [Xylariaceae sp. FL0016]
MSFSAKDKEIYRRNEKGDQNLAAKEREELVKTYLPPPPAQQQSRNREKLPRIGLRKFLKYQLYVFFYFVVHAVFSLYIRSRMAWHAVKDTTLSVLKHHYNTPDYVEKDIKALARKPRHVSFILTLEDGGRRDDALDKLQSEVAEIAAWCSAADIPKLSFYERTGVLKASKHQTLRRVNTKLEAWFRAAPPVMVKVPNESPIETEKEAGYNGRPLEITLISEVDGREALTSLTQVFASLAQKEKIVASEIETPLIDSELCDTVMTEPDLLISFAPYVDLQGYPPWPIRLTEIYCSPDNSGVGYQVFLRGLRKYSKATFKMGK